MNTNPFEDDRASYLVLANSNGQHSLWPSGLTVPSGWQRVHGGASRDTCLRYVAEHWTDLAPRPHEGDR